MILVVLLRGDRGVGIVGVGKEITRKGSVTKDPESHGRRHKLKEFTQKCLHIKPVQLHQINPLS